MEGVAIEIFNTSITSILSMAQPHSSLSDESDQYYISTETHLHISPLPYFQ